MSQRFVEARMPTLAERYSSVSNAFGPLRFMLATWVLVSHAFPIGYAIPSFGQGLVRGQTDIGSMALDGFFVLSGFLVAASGLRSTWPRFLWYRAVRIMPGLWVCTLLIVFGFAPLVAYIENGSLDGFWSHPLGPFQYLWANWFGAMEQWPISGLLADVPFGHVMGGPSAFAGSMWTLHYEYICYLGVAVLAALTILRRAPKVILFLIAGCFCLIMYDLITSTTWAIRPPARGAIGPFPLIGSFAYSWTLYLGFLFMLGVAARLYMHKLPMHGGLALLALGVALVTMSVGGWVAFGLPAWGYVLLYVAVAAPRWARGSGRRFDYSYGMYIYAFPIQQLLALVGFTQFGLFAYIVVTIAGTFVLAAASWHFVERPAMRFKDLDPGAWRLRRRRPAPVAAPDAATGSWSPIGPRDAVTNPSGDRPAIQVTPAPLPTSSRDVVGGP